MLNKQEFKEKRKAEFDFFISILRDYEQQGLRPHQAIFALNDLIERTRGTKNEDKFYWEGVFGPKFTSEKPDNIPKGYSWEKLKN